MYTGWLEYGTDSALAFRVAHFSHPDQGKNFWMLLGTGPWEESSDVGCWAVTKSWVVDDDLTFRVENATESPFDESHIFHERFLSRNEVLDKSGAVDWAVARRDELLALHPCSLEFLGLS